MKPDEAVELVRHAVWMATLVGSPLLLVGLVVGLLVSLIQALTQIQDQTLNAVAKIIAMVVALIFCLPWITDRMMHYSRSVYENIPAVVSR